MSLPLLDFRCKITPVTDAVLDALQQSSGRERGEIVRDVLAEWADDKIHEPILMEQTLRRQGLGGLERRTAGRTGPLRGIGGDVIKSAGG